MTGVQCRYKDNKYNSWACTKGLYHGALGTLSFVFLVKENWDQQNHDPTHSFQARSVLMAVLGWSDLSACIEPCLTVRS